MMFHEGATVWTRVLSVLVVSSAVLIPWGPVVAQDVIVLGLDDRQGWLGLEIGFDRVTEPGAAEGVVLVIEGVVSGSPAEEAGVQAGDVLLEIDGAAASREALRRLEEELEAGEFVALELEREGEAVSLLVEAAEPPDALSGRGLRVLREGPDGEVREWSIRIDVDSLRAEIEALNLEQLEEVRLRADSIRELFNQDGFGLDSERLRINERRLRELSRELERNGEVLEEARRLGESIRFRVDSLGFDGFSPYSQFFGPTPPLPPLVWGQRVVAGAELTDLNASLGRYFGVDEGVLVTNVTPRSPAADSGLEPGDIIVELDGEQVTSVREVRELVYRLSFAGGWPPGGDPLEREAISVTVVREGTRVELQLSGR